MFRGTQPTARRRRLPPRPWTADANGVRIRPNRCRGADFGHTGIAITGRFALRRRRSGAGQRLRAEVGAGRPGGVGSSRAGAPLAMRRRPPPRHTTAVRWVSRAPPPVRTSFSSCQLMAIALSLPQVIRRFIAHALRLFLANGYDATTVDEIAAAAIADREDRPRSGLRRRALAAVAVAVLATAIREWAATDAAGGRPGRHRRRGVRGATSGGRLNAVSCAAGWRAVRGWIRRPG